MKTAGMWSDIMMDTRQRQAPYGILNASWTLEREDLTIQFFGDNLTNEIAELFKNVEDVQPLITVNRPRTLGVKFAWKLKK